MKWSIISFALLALTSCQHREEALDPTLENFFSADDAAGGGARKPERFVDAMSAAGARADGTLSKQHFDGRHLNSLGEDKLARMLTDDRAAEPMRVYLNMDEADAASKARRAAAVAFLVDAGLAESQVEVVFGQNPENWNRASRSLESLPKTETGGAEGAAATGKGTDASVNGTDKAVGTSGAGGGGGAGDGGVNLFR
jgi:hypothetical protein